MVCHHTGCGTTIFGDGTLRSIISPYWLETGVAIESTDNLPLRWMPKVMCVRSGLSLKINRTVFSVNYLTRESRCIGPKLRFDSIKGCFHGGYERLERPSFDANLMERDGAPVHLPLLHLLQEHIARIRC
jgi:hypothetical protein